MEKYEAQRYKEPVGNLEDTIAAILRSLECGGDQESNDDDLRVLIKQTCSQVLNLAFFIKHPQLIVSFKVVG